MDITDIVVFTLIAAGIGYAIYVYVQHFNAKKAQEEEDARRTAAAVSSAPKTQKKKPAAPASVKIKKEKPAKLPRITFGSSQKILTSFVTKKYIIFSLNDKTIRILEKDSYSDPKEASLFSRQDRIGTVTAVLPGTDTFCISLQNNTGAVIYTVVSTDSGKLTLRRDKVIVFKEGTAAPITHLRLSKDFVLTVVQGDTTAVLWDYEGQRIASYKFNQGDITDISLSPDTHFLSAAGFTSEAKIVTVNRDKNTNAVTGCTQASYTTQHHASIKTLAYNNKNTKLYTVSMDGDWKRWNVTGDLKKNDPACEVTRKVPALFTEYIENISTAAQKKKVARIPASKYIPQPIPQTSGFAKTPSMNNFILPERRDADPSVFGMFMDENEKVIVFYTEYHVFVVSVDSGAVLNSFILYKPANIFVYLEKERVLLAGKSGESDMLYYEDLHPVQKKK